MQQGRLRNTHTVLVAAVAKALLSSEAVMWFQGDYIMVEERGMIHKYTVPLGVHTNKRRISCRPGPIVRFTNNGVEVLGNLLRYRKPWRDCPRAVEYQPHPTESPYGSAWRVFLLAETLAQLGLPAARIHDLVDKNTYEPGSLMEAANLDQVVGEKNEKILVAHDNVCLERMRQEALPKYHNIIN